MSLPLFPEFKPLGLEDKKEVSSHFEDNKVETSDFSFANLFFWRKYDRPKLTLLNDNLCLLLDPVNKALTFLPPIGTTKIPETFAVMFDYLKNPPQVRGASEKCVQRWFAGKENFKIELDRNNSDYIYRVEDLVNLTGKRYDAKRNWIKRFLSQFNPKYHHLLPEMVPACQKLVKSWSKNRTEPMLKYEIQAIEEALSHLKELHLIGRVVSVAGEIVAFMIGGKLSPEMAIVYIQVASRDHPGLPQYFHQKFAAEELSDFKYVNWEQDLGIPGLRKAKLSYHPCRIINKYEITRL